ncbi:MAG: NAD-dependent epimerase/dehydratase family protein [Gemmatimonadaceae bacterium]
MSWLTRRRAARAPAQPAAPSHAPTEAPAPERPITLVTGGTGFLGSHLVRLLANGGDTALRVLTTTSPAWLAELGVETVRGSITVPEDVERAVKGVTHIYHLAGRVSRSSDDAPEMYALHVEGTRYLCDSAKRAGVKSMVLVSSSGTLAVSDQPDVAANEESLPPLEIILRWPYYASKVYQERVALESLAGAGVKLVIVNPSLLLGPGDERLSSTKLVLDFLARKIPVVPTGGLSLVDVRDAAQAVRSALRRGVHGERYLLGATNWTFRELFGRLERLTKIPAPRFSLPPRIAVPGARAMTSVLRKWNMAPSVEPSEIEMAGYYWYVDSSKARRELGFTTRDPGETLSDTVSFVQDRFLERRGGAWEEGFKSADAAVSPYPGSARRR